MRVYEKLKAVNGPKSFLEFARVLLEDREGEAGKPIDVYGRGVNGRENHTIEAFLEAAIAWAEDSDFGENQDLHGASPWRKVASFLYCGKIYE